MIGWLDCSMGASGDMLLGALVDAGVPLEVLQGALDELGLGLQLVRAEVTRASLRATKVDVLAPPADAASSALPLPSVDENSLLVRSSVDENSLLVRSGGGVRGRRGLAEVLAITSRLTDDGVRGTAQQVFELLAEAEGRVHGIAPDQVHFHEVGALDSIADVVGVCAGVAHLGLTALHCSPLALGGGTAQTEHGRIPVPGPAVLEVLARKGIPAHGGPVDHELLTPTAAALLATLVTAWGPMPPMTPTASAAGAGSRDHPERPNTTRLVLGEPADQSDWWLLEANVDDQDPRLWPHVIDQLLRAGAADAWVTPIVMKKGRPALTLSVLTTDRGQAEQVVFRETTTIGLRAQRVDKAELPRRTVTVDVQGEPVRVKLTSSTATPEWDDVVRAATALGLPAKDVLRRAQSAATAPGPSR